jgi:hypothetical protein
VVDSWLLYRGSRGGSGGMVQREFYEELALDLVDNNFDSVGLRRRHVGGLDPAGVSFPETSLPVTGYVPRATPTNKTKKRVSSDCFLLRHS